jgi:hypothetical protein
MTSSKPRAPDRLLIIGYTTRRHLLLDLDDTSLEKARRLADLIIDEWPEVGDCLILQSSVALLSVRLRYSWNNWPWISVTRPGFHLVFDNCIGYNKACRICETLAGLNVLERDYLRIRTFRGDMTLRVSEAALSTGAKPAPEPVEYLINTAQKWRDRKIDEYLAFRDAALSLTTRELHAEDEADYGAYGTNYSCKEGPVHILVKSDGL